MRISRTLTCLSSLIALLAMPACGDDGKVTSASGTDATDATDPSATNPTTTEAMTTEETPTTSTASASEGTTDDTTTEPVTPTTTTPMPSDTDMDGIDDADDNCPDVANPNQLDFDSNGLGNACDEMVFSMITGTLISSAVADAGVGSCNIPLDFVSTGGTVKVQLDDNAQVARIEVGELRVADIIEKKCTIFIVNATVSIKEFAMTNSVGPFPVQVPHTQAEHDAGTVNGTTDLPHPVLATGLLEASTDPNMPAMPSDLLLDAALPTFGVDVSGAGEAMTLTWDNDSAVIAVSEFEASGLTIEMQIIGLTGSLMLTK